jgi:hypothetical protein
MIAELHAPALDDEHPASLDSVHFLSSYLAMLY